MVLCILGRQPALGLAELERLYGARSLDRPTDTTALVAIPLDTILSRPLGGTMKIAEVLTTLHTPDWRQASQQFVRFFASHAPATGKLTIGLSTYGFTITPREVQKVGIVVKQKLKKRDGSIRIIPQDENALNTAQVLHNKLGTTEHKKEIIFIKTDDNKTIIAETKYVQDIEAYTFRDRSRPKRDAFVGMLPPKLAQIMINLGAPQISVAGPVPQGPSHLAHAKAVRLDGLPSLRATHRDNSVSAPRLLDPFCGTGVVLQEAALMGYSVYGTDLSEKMIDYSKANLEWLAKTHHIDFDYSLQQADATTALWQQPIDAVVCETYLGTPFSAEPSPKKLESVRHDCNVIIKKFLQNLAPQLQPGTPLCIAVPAWHVKNSIKHLSLLDDLKKIGYNRIDFTCAFHEELVYHREDQIVGRELLVLTRS